jgi:hypothetical protein
MGVEQFSQTVRGSGGTLRTNASGVMEVDNYPGGGEIDAPATDAYPVSLNPAATIQEFIVTQNHADLEVEFHTVGGDVYQAFRGSVTGVRSRVEIDKVVVSDPNGSNATFTAEWSGE